MYKYTLILCFSLISSICFADCNLSSIDINSKQQIYDGFQCVNNELDNIIAEMDSIKTAASRVEREHNKLISEEAICETQKAVAARSGNAIDKQLANECYDLSNIRQSKLMDIMDEYDKLQENFKLLQDTKTKLSIKKSNLELLFNNINTRPDRLF